jgi:o-succinylbenzoate synthase
MNFNFEIAKHRLQFKFRAGTSRGVLTHKDSFFIKITDGQRGVSGIGEAGPLSGLSSEFGKDLTPEFKVTLDEIAEGEMLLSEKLDDNYSIPSSVKFAIETALLDLDNGGRRCIFDNDFYSAKKQIPINGLVWMGDMDFMREQIRKKLSEGFNCIKIKIGALNFDDEVSLIRAIRKEFDPEQIVIRVDANGAYDYDQAMKYMDILHSLEVHSIEQPVKAGQWEVMKRVSNESPLPVALDEELINVRTPREQSELLNTIEPQFIVLKPSLHGGLSETQSWINLAEENGINWWITSALESNIGLNAIAQFTARFNNHIHQGLGTGQLYQNNIESPLEIKKGYIQYNKSLGWQLKPLDFRPL